MKQVKVTLEFDDETLGEKWMNEDNLKTLLYTTDSTGEHLLKVIEFEESETAKAVGHDLLVMQKIADTWQKCPKCDGQGIVSKPPYIAGDVHKWESTPAVYICDVCHGAKIIKR